MMSRSRRDDRGAAMVEFAIVLPVLLLILMGIIEFGRAYNAQVSIQAAAREGARELALRHSSADVESATRERRPLGGRSTASPRPPARASGDGTGEGDDHRVVLVHGPAVRAARPHCHRSHAMRSLIRSRLRRDDAGASDRLGRDHDGRPARHGRPRHRRRPALRRAPRAPERRRRRRAGGGPGLRRWRLPRRDDHRRHVRRRQRPRRQRRGRRGVRIRPRARPVRHAPGERPRRRLGRGHHRHARRRQGRLRLRPGPRPRRRDGRRQRGRRVGCRGPGDDPSPHLLRVRVHRARRQRRCRHRSRSGLNYVYFHDTTDAGTCPAGPSGPDLPGGFGWLDSSGECGVDVSADGWVDDKPGNGVPNDCEPVRLADRPRCWSRYTTTRTV